MKCIQCKYIISLIFIISFAIIRAQTRAKGNIVFAPVGMINLALEKKMNNHFTLQEEIFISPWKSFDNKYMQIYMGTLEGRYYFKENMNKWFVGVYGSAARFNFERYWNKSVVLDENNVPVILGDGSIRTTEIYHKGFTFIIGISGGYHFNFNEHWGTDIFLGFGSSQAIYKAYYKDNNDRSDKAEKWNKSGEFIPTRGGIMLTYKL